MKTVILMMLLTAFRVSADDPRILAWNDEIAARDLDWITGEDAVPIRDLHPAKRSPAFPRPEKDAPVVIRATDRGRGGDGEPVELRCPLPAKLERPLLLLLPDADAPSGLRGWFVEDDTDSFPWGAQRFINTTGSDLLVKCEDARIRVPAGWDPVDLDLGGDDRNIGVLIGKRRGDQSEILYTSVWNHRADTRRIVFLVEGDGKRLGRIALKTVPERRGRNTEE